MPSPEQSLDFAGTGRLCSWHRGIATPRASAATGRGTSGRVPDGSGADVMGVGGMESLVTEAGVRAGSSHTTAMKHQTPPRVSIGMPVFNGRPYIERAVRALLAQTFEDFELIILDNASTDGTYEYAGASIDDPRVRLERNERNIGAIANFKKVVGLAQGEYFMWAAVDDLWEPEFIARLVSTLDKYPRAGLAMSATGRFLETGKMYDVVR